MKTIKTLVEIPAAYKWMAQDSDGAWWFYTNKPSPNYENGQWQHAQYYSGMDAGELSINFGQNQDWRNTLRRIEEYEDVSE